MGLLKSSSLLKYKKMEVSDMKCKKMEISDMKYKKMEISEIPVPKPIPQEWVSKQVAILEAQATKLRWTIARRKSIKDTNGTASIMDHYKQVLADLEHQITQLQK